MDQEQIIPTQHKSKIPYTLSYPVGAQSVSEALKGIPQLGQLTISFRFWKRIVRHHGSATPYGVIDAIYYGPTRFHSAPRTIEEQSRDPRWSITIYAVPRSLRHAIQAKILAEALPAIRIWLVSNQHASNREGRHGLSFSFDELKNELISEENSSLLWQTEKAHR